MGKSTMAANLATTLALDPTLRVVAVDLDPQNMLRLHLGVPLHEGRGFAHMLDQPQLWHQVGQRTDDGMTVLPYGALDLSASVNMSARLEQAPALLAEPLRILASDPASMVVVDTEPGPSTALRAILPHVDVLLTVLAADAASAALFPDIESGRAYGHGLPAAQYFVINQFDPMTRLGPRIARSLAAQMGPRLLGVVHRDEYVSEALAAQKTVAAYAPRAQASHDIAGICRKLLTALGRY
ncbi:cellulose synthase operon protein YhjQ [Gluconacetobacter tumulisoli]|uniref:Cellulose synthase operon protein YhjQ n=1 Tax=Gluconacetobacter tumulisoli TaxID=1286189 RepID=A0A7W4PJN1_9PROT|nr:cellulose synthase operon protein YhjQ [Gluconacetobacter tumulisoli]